MCMCKHSKLSYKHRTDQKQIMKIMISCLDIIMEPTCSLKTSVKVQGVIRFFRAFVVNSLVSVKK